MDERGAYRVLKLEYGADPDKIKAAYRKMALKLHPDRNGSSAEFEQITKAYELLKSRPTPTKSIKKHNTNVPKTISDCTARAGDNVTIKYGRDLAWATIVE